MTKPQGQRSVWLLISERTLARISQAGAEDADELRRRFLRQRLLAHRAGGV